MLSADVENGTITEMKQVRRSKMEIPRKIGMGILMIVPTFVGAGAIWDIFDGSWLAIIVWIILMCLFSGALITGRFSSKESAAAFLRSNEVTH